MTRSSWFASTTTLGAFTIALTALAADEATQTVSAKGLTFQAPASWKSTPPSSQMRAAQLHAGPVEGDQEPAELVVFVFPGGAGTVEANLARWQGQFVGADGKPPKVSSEKRDGKNVKATFVEIAGRYVAAMTPGSPEKNDKPDYRLMGAIVEAPGVAYFLKMVGPEKTMKAARPGFDKLVGSLSVEAR